jgi:hypothetical protein
MQRRPVFDDLAQREQFRDRLALAGITIPDAKLNPRPSFASSVLAEDDQRSTVKAALGWFASVFREGTYCEDL